MLFSKYPSLALLLTTYLLTGCNEISNDTDISSPVEGNTDISSPVEEDISPLSSFNFTEINAGTTNVKQMTLNWDAASSETGVTYSVCEKDTTQTNDCLELTSVTDQLTATVTLDSLVDALSKDYFILASMGNVVEASNEMSLSTDTITKMIGYFKASNTGHDDKFGTSIALSNDGTTLAVTSSYEDSSSTGVNSIPNNDSDASGAVYLFKKTNGSWAQTAYLKASNAHQYYTFGTSIALSADGNTLAVGSYSEGNDMTGVITDGSEVTDNNNNASYSGAVYLFKNSNNTWEQIAYVKALNAQPGDFFGYSVTLSGDGNTLAVGARYESKNGTGVNSSLEGEITGSGAAYLFNYSGNVWTQNAYIKASDTAYGDNFGTSVALSYDGKTLAVGAPFESSALAGIITDGSETTDTSNIGPAGAVYLFINENNAWSQSAFVKSSDPQYGDWFGEDVALSNDGYTLAVGSPSPLAIDRSGATYLFENNDNVWSQTIKLIGSNTSDDDDFGSNIALSGDGGTLAVGARGEDSNNTGINTISNNLASSAGAVYQFKKDDDNGWVQNAYVKASNTEEEDNFGASVTLSSDGNSLAVSASAEDSDNTGVVKDGSEVTDGNNNTIDSGAVYLY